MKTIRIARTRAGLTQKKLAELVDRDQSEISRIEAGKTALTVPLLLRMAKVLKVPPGKLLDETRDKAA
jgi:transcriptional regulator with XRE-family HTH domain